MTCNVKLFSDDTFLFTVAREANEAAEHMNHDLQLVSQWAHDWRMSFNPDPQKKAVELLFSRKRNEIDHPVILFNNIPVRKVNYSLRNQDVIGQIRGRTHKQILTAYKHLGIILDSELSFSPHIKAAISKTRKGIGLEKGHWLPQLLLLPAEVRRSF